LLSVLGPVAVLVALLVVWSQGWSIYQKPAHPSCWSCRVHV
jgi:hypothetical protein